jgi:hypothetical protein
MAHPTKIISANLECLSVDEKLSIGPASDTHGILRIKAPIAEGENLDQYGWVTRPILPF